MKLLEELKEKRTELTEQWLEAIFRTYPLDTAGFMRRQKDQFANPVQHRVQQAVEGVLDALLEKKLDTDKVTPALDDLIRIRAVQEFTPARAVGVIYLLKGLVREMTLSGLKDVKRARELLQFESKIDSLALISFDIYTRCRQQLFEFRVNEIKNRQASLLRRARMVLGTAAEEQDPTNP